LKDFDLTSGQRVLEIGPGTGYYSAEAALRVGSTGRLICLDIQKEMLVEVRARLGRLGFGRSDLVQADAAALPFQSSSFDHVFLVGVLGEIPDRGHAVGEFHRVLRTDGRLSVSEQLPDPDFIPRGALRKLLRGSGLNEVRSRGHLWYTSIWSKP
jgi:ubiquinone/menaquinone biosynthesis C-methylase UbiE